MVITRINSGASSVADKINLSLSNLFTRINSGLSELDFETPFPPVFNISRNIIYNLHGVIRDKYASEVQKEKLNYTIYGD